MAFTLYLFVASILRKLLLGFSQDKSLCSFLCGCACLSFSDLLAYGYVVMMLNVLRSDINNKIQHERTFLKRGSSDDDVAMGLYNPWIYVLKRSTEFCLHEVA